MNKITGIAVALLVPSLGFAALDRLFLATSRAGRSVQEYSDRRYFFWCGSAPAKLALRQRLSVFCAMVSLVVIALYLYVNQMIPGLMAIPTVLLATGPASGYQFWS